MSRKSKSRPEKVNVPSDLFGVYATLGRGLRGGDFRSDFIASSLYVDCMAGHLKMARMALTMVAACAAPSADRSAAARAQMSVSLKDKARRFILRNLNSPHLGPEALCRELGMSRSKLYRLLDAEGGVSRYVQHLRMLESFSQLTDPSNTKPIVRIADELGIPDHSQFSRAFRREFGIRPTDAREAAQAGSVPSITHAHPVAPHSIGGLLSGL